MKSWTIALSVIFLAGIVVAALLYPHAMLGPGKLKEAHRSLEKDCFACHVPFAGASASRCGSCHRREDIGVRDSRGMLLVSDARRVPFHQALIEGDCTACHSEHGRAGSTKKQVMPFEHALLKPDRRGTCQGCHKAPVDDLHAGGILPCAQCHQTSGWKPATFDHGKYFPLTGEHNAPCSNCHQGPGFKSYTCYGCHEHERSRMIAEHLEEGIRNIDGCVRCHNGTGLRGHDGRNERDEGDD